MYFCCCGGFRSLDRIRVVNNRTLLVVSNIRSSSRVCVDICRSCSGDITKTLMTFTSGFTIKKPEHIIGDIWVQNLMNKMLTKLDDKLIKLKHKA